MENFKYLGAIISNEGSKPVILSRIGQITSALSRLKIIWRDKNISLASKVADVHLIYIPLCLWELDLDSRNREKSPIEMRCYIFYKDHVTNEEIRNRIQNAIGGHDDLLTMVKKRKLRWSSQDPRTWRRQVCRGQWKEQEEEEDRRRDGKITSRNWRVWDLEIPWGQRKTGNGEKVLLQRHLWCPDDLRG